MFLFEDVVKLFLCALAALFAADLPEAVLQPGVAHQGVFVGRLFFGDFFQRQQLRAGLDAVDGGERPVFAVVADGEALRRGCGINDAAEAVAHGRGAKERQHEEGAAVHTVMGERGAEVFVDFRVAHGGCDVDKAAEAVNGVVDDAREDLQRLAEFELKQAVRQRADVAEVAEEVADAFFHRAGGDGVVAGGERFEQVGIDGVVEDEDFAVERFPRVVGVAFFVDGAAARGQQSGSGDEGEEVFFHDGFSSVEGEAVSP